MVEGKVQVEGWGASPGLKKNGRGKVRRKYGIDKGEGWDANR